MQKSKKTSYVQNNFIGCSYYMYVSAKTAPTKIISTKTIPTNLKKKLEK